MLRIVVLLQLIIASIWAVDCKDLDSDEKIRTFFKETHKSNPLLKKNVSTSMDIKTNDKGKKELATIHSLRMEDKKRVFFVQGGHAPKCSIQKGDKDYICNECSYKSSTICRSYKAGSSNTKVSGTNINSKDFEILESKDFTNKCYPVKKNKKYIKIVSSKQAGDSVYDTVISYYDKSKKVPVTMNYQSAKVLKKVYRFFPKYYIQIDGEWVSTVSRVRSVNGSEKKYSFETLTYVKKDGAGKYLLYTNPTADPLISKTNIKQLFNTNR